MKKLITVLLAMMAATGMGSAVADNNCQPGTADIVIHDDGEAENGYGWTASVSEGRFAEPFEAAAYPATITSLCYSFLSDSGVTEFDFEIVVWDSDGTGGSPGTELGRMSAIAHPVTEATPVTVNFEEYDISSLDLNITGPVYIGLQWDPTSVENVFIAADASSETTLNNGYLWSKTQDDTGYWEGITTQHGDYRALMVRAIMPLRSQSEHGAAVSIPTMQPWGVALFSLLMLALGGLSLRLFRN